jgi:hypothetical protein
MTVQRDFNNVGSLSDNFYETQEKVKSVQKKEKKREKKSNRRKTYERRIEREDFDSFRDYDFLYFFQDTARKAGINYNITNYARDLKMFKKAQENYNSKEILIMIEFLFLSEQSYLDVRKTSPTIFISGWVNSIYPDSQDWINDEFMTKSEKRHSDREWSDNSTEDNAVIGEWDF